MTCEKCGSVVTVGAWPFCPHGVPHVAIIDDSLEGGPRRFETMGDDAPYIETKSQWRREVERRNLVPIVKHDRAYYDRMFRHANERRRDGVTD